MGEKSKAIANKVEPERRIYAAPALEKGLDILEMLCQSEGALSQKEIAEIMETTEGAVEALLQRAKTNLREKLSSFYKKKKNKP